MVEIPDSLRSMFTGQIQESEDELILEIPKEEIDQRTISPRHTYRIALLAPTATPPDETNSGQTDKRRNLNPPVSEGDICDVTIEDLGSKGDGIARVERGFVVIVPGVSPGDEPTVEIQRVNESVAFATIVRDN